MTGAAHRKAAGDAWAADTAFFAENPGRTIRLRPSLPHELSSWNPQEHEKTPLMIVALRPGGRCDYQPMKAMIELQDAEEPLRELWAFVEAHKIVSPGTLIRIDMDVVRRLFPNLGGALATP